MKIFKPHFWYNKSQRNGVFLLVFLILILQVFIFVDFFSSDEVVELDNQELFAFQKEIDSLKKLEVKGRKPKIYPFNPNYITDYKGEQLGMSLEEIDRLLDYRKLNKFVNSKKEFQQITKVSDSLLGEISPYFKFPDWVLKKDNQDFNPKKKKTKYVKKVTSTSDINKATAEDFRTISGIGIAFSERIIKYRNKLQGFSLNSQLGEVWGLEKEVVDRVLAQFKITQKPIIKKININTVSFKELLKNPYIDYDLCIKIFNYRDEVAELREHGHQELLGEVDVQHALAVGHHERVVLLGRVPRERVEDVGVVRRALLDRPARHRRRDHVCEFDVQRRTRLDGLDQALVGRLGQALLHHIGRENVLAEHLPGVDFVEGKGLSNGLGRGYGLDGVHSGYAATHRLENSG